MSITADILRCPVCRQGLPQTDLFSDVNIIKVRDKITLEGSEAIMQLLKMTPYFYHTPTGGIERLAACTHLETEIEFVLGIMKK